MKIGIVFNGATGELAARQHLPALLAIRDEGGLSLSDGSRLIPEVTLVARNVEKLAATAASTGFPIYTTDLAAALSSPDAHIFFDAAPSGQRIAVAYQALAAGKHLYLEKPIAPTVAEALALHHAAQTAGLKAGTVQDKLFLPGFAALLALTRTGFLGRLLELRIEMGRWIFDGHDRPGQRPSWNYRKQDGGGLILDMFPHWRYVVDALAGPIRAVSAIARTHIPTRVDEQGRPYQADVEDSVFAQLELECGAIASLNSTWCTRPRREFPIQIQLDGTEGSAVAGPFACWKQSRAEAPAGPIAAALPQSSAFEGWTSVPTDPAAPNSYRAGWDLFLRQVAEDTPFPYTLLAGAKGVQLAQAAHQSTQERRWIDLPPL